MFKEGGEAGTKVAGLCCRYGMSDANCNRWKSKYAGLTVSELKRLKALEEENQRFKQVVGEQALDIRALKKTGLKKIFKPGVKRLVVSHALKSSGLSERKACWLVDIPSSVCRHQPKPDEVFSSFLLLSIPTKRYAPF